MVSKVASIQTIVYRGSGTKHRDFCHDFLVHHETDDFFVGVVMDGCTDGIHTQFASSFFGKIFNLLMRSEKALDRWPSDAEPLDVANGLMYRFCHDMIFHKNALRMTHRELYCTILLSIYSKRKDKLLVVAFGDGYIHVNGKGIKIENTRYQDTIENGKLKAGKDKPSYLITDIDTIIRDPMVPYPEFGDTEGAKRVQLEREGLRSAFDEWFMSQPQYEFTNVHDYSITTDGIFSFRSAGEDVTEQVIELLLDRKAGYGGTSQETPRKKMNIISFRNRPGEKPNPDKLNAVNDDDVSIIRVIIDKVESE